MIKIIYFLFDLLLFEFEYENKKKNVYYINNVIINFYGIIGWKKDIIEKEVMGEGSKGNFCIKKVK